MALVTQRILRGLVPSLDPNRAPAHRDRPERILLGVKPGHTPSDKPPVRIFLGSERAQFRAEKVFLWSVEKHRDPSRIYEIYLLKELRGFSRRFWLTGFTNYRFAIPRFCEFAGRAIYNDADQVYLTDPANLFDREMGSAGFLSINDRDTSVMLIDCQAMAETWSEKRIYSENRKSLEARARKAKLWGELEPGWNARDKEYEPGKSHLVHFTTLHTQPWRPFPEQFVYFENPTGSLWFDLEVEARKAGFMPVSATRPTSQWPDVALALSSRPEGPELQELLGTRAPKRLRQRISLHRVLEYIPDGDLPWVIDRLFHSTGHLEVVVNEPLRSTRPRYTRSEWFWLQHFRQAQASHPETRWRLIRQRGFRRREFYGGPCPDGPIRVLTRDKPGHNHQALAVAGELARRTGREIHRTRLKIGPVGYLARSLLRLPAPATALDNAAVIVAAGWLPTRAARWIRQTAGRDIRLVLLGRKAGQPDSGQVVVGCRHFGLPPHPARLETLLPPNAGVAPEPTDQALESFRDWLDAPARIAVLLGGSSRSHVLDRQQLARLGEFSRQLAKDSNALLLVVGSRRSAPLNASLAGAFGSEARVYKWQAEDPANPYALALQHSEILVVTGESESMLADAIQSARPTVIWPVQRRRPGPWRKFSDRVAARALEPVINRRGSIRPQQGLTYLCARALERGWILPSRDIDRLHRELVSAGLATLGESPPPDNPGPAGILEEVADFVENELGLAAPAEANQPGPGRTREAKTQDRATKDTRNVSNR